MGRCSLIVNRFKNLREMVVAYFKVLSQHLPGEIEENNRNLSGLLVTPLRFESSTSQIQV
jgi:hypothetical protein